MATTRKNSDDFKREFNNLIFSKLVEITNQFELETINEMNQNDFQECWRCVLTFPDFYVSEFAEETHIDEEWVQGWEYAKKDGNEFEGYLDTDKLPSRKMAVHYIRLAVALLDDNLKPRSNNWPTSSGVGEKSPEEASLGEEMAKVLTMPDGRPWGTTLVDDIFYEEYVSFRGRRSLFHKNILTFGDLVKMTRSGLLRMPNFGKVSLGEVNKFLFHHNLQLDMDLD